MSAPGDQPRDGFGPSAGPRRAARLSCSRAGRTRAEWPPIQQRTPGVQVEGHGALPHSIAGIATAVPAFIGYTEKAEQDGRPCPLQPVRIASFADYGAVFGGAYRTPYTLTAVPPKTDGAVAIGGALYRPDVMQRHDLGNSVRLFYENGGADCIVVSVGNYQEPTAHGALAAGLAAVRDLAGPTMLVIPEAVRLADDDHAALVLEMLAQCGERRDRVAILDVPAARDSAPDPVARFRAIARGAPATSLQFGAAYYPFVQTSLVDASTLGYGDLVAPARATLQSALQEAAGGAALRNLIEKITEVGPEDPAYPALSQALLSRLPALRQLMTAMAAIGGTLPPSGAIAGVYTQVDGSKGVWSAPANVALSAVLAPTVVVTDKMQRDLNVSAADGLSINALRTLQGGTLVWGARTLAGNSSDWRYIQVRRLLIYIEQSIRLALGSFASEPNAAPAWGNAASMVRSFLRDLWEKGAFAGSSPADAFSVACGIGTTMTAQDLIEGRLIVQIQLAVTHPAEFIALAIEQQMQAGA